MFNQSSLKTNSPFFLYTPSQNNALLSHMSRDDDVDAAKEAPHEHERALLSHCWNGEHHVLYSISDEQMKMKPPIWDDPPAEYMSNKPKIKAPPDHCVCTLLVPKGYCNCNAVELSCISNQKSAPLRLDGSEKVKKLRKRIRKTKERCKESHRAGSIRKEKFTTSEVTPNDFIHVRARRGQATDSHSLAERVRREKINERMRKLRELVPGCSTKSTGKALMLEEIINYVKSLQNQVELLSMRLASLSPCYDFTTVEISNELCEEQAVEAQETGAMASQSREKSIDAHFLAFSACYTDPMEEKLRLPYEEETSLESMGANEWDDELQYLLDWRR